MTSDMLFRRCRALAAGLMLVLAATAASPAGDLFKQPSIGMDPPRVIQSVPPSVMPSLDANQCQLAVGTCPLGRLQRSGGRCFCVSAGGAARQGTTRTRPQDARPPVARPAPGQ